MNIFFDILLRNPDMHNQVSKEDALFYKTVREFIKDRLISLDSLIEQEEKTNEKKNILCYTEIITETPPSIAFRHYSLDLRNKMTNCFSEEDGEYLTLLIYQRLTRLLK